MAWTQKTFTLKERPRGVHLITRDVVVQLPELRELHVGLMHLFIHHTSASLTLNENASPDVRADQAAPARSSNSSLDSRPTA